MEFRITTIELEEIDNATLKKGQGEIVKIRINGICPFDEFYSQLDEADIGKLSAIFGRMAFQCENDVILSRKLCEVIKKGRQDLGYAYKEKDLRLNCTRTKNRFIIYNGGHKETKEKDKKEFISKVLSINAEQEKATNSNPNHNTKSDNEHYGKRDNQPQAACRILDRTNPDEAAETHSDVS